MPPDAPIIMSLSDFALKAVLGNYGQGASVSGSARQNDGHNSLDVD
jgi:hypothetical protein